VGASVVFLIVVDWEWIAESSENTSSGEVSRCDPGVVFEVGIPASFCASRSWKYAPFRSTSSSCVPCSTIEPSDITTMLLAALIVDNLWAMTIVVRPLEAASRASWTTDSDLVSKADVASSRSKIRGSLTTARAMAIRCF